MKVIRVDNYNRESIADSLIEEGLSEDQARAKAAELNDSLRDHNWFYRAVADDYRLSRGMDDIV